MKIAQYLDKRLIHFLPDQTKEEALRTLVDDALKVKELPCGDAFYKAICEREKIVSTGIGMGVAIPHAKLSDIREFFIAIGILERGIDWHALDGAPVRIIFLIGGPDNKQNEYLKILSALTTCLRDETMRKELLTVTTQEEVLKLFEGL